MTTTMVLAASISRWRNCHEDHHFRSNCSVGSCRHCGSGQRSRPQDVLRAAGSTVLLTQEAGSRRRLPPRSRRTPKGRAAMKPLATVAVDGLVAGPPMSESQACSDNENQLLTTDNAQTSRLAVVWIELRESAWLAF